MKKIKDQNYLLDQQIDNLELKRENDLYELKNQFYTVVDNLKPSNLIAETFTEFKTNSRLKSNIVDTAISVVGGYLSKRLLLGNSYPLVKKILGYAIQFGVTNLISKKVKSN